MLRKKLESKSVESESGTKIADSGFLIIYEKPADFGFGLPSLINNQFDFFKVRKSSPLLYAKLIRILKEEWHNKKGINFIIFSISFSRQILKLLFVLSLVLRTGLFPIEINRIRIRRI